MNLPTSERAHLLRQFWNELEETGKHGHSTYEYFQWLEDNGWDTTNYDSNTFNDDWEVACEDEPEDEPEDVNGIETREDAYKWLQDKTKEYGNTYFFPDAEKYMLNRLIDKFGNTYFWNR